MSNYLDLRYNEVSFKAVHNSYQRDETLAEQLTWHENDPANAGCRGVELDISQSSSGLEWSVGHDPEYGRFMLPLATYLFQLRDWGLKDPDHDVITLYLDLKSVNVKVKEYDPITHISKFEISDKFPDQLDAYIRNNLGNKDGTRVYIPSKLQGDKTTLAAGAAKGWPKLSDLRGKFIICLTGDSDAKTAYAEAHSSDRLCFVDIARNPGKCPRPDPKDEPDRVFFNYDLEAISDSTCNVFNGAAKQANEIIRVHTIRDKSLWDRALSCGCNLLATDMVKGTKWAKVGSDPFVKLKPLVLNARRERAPVLSAD